MRDIFGSVVNSGDTTQLDAVSEDILPSVTDVFDIGSSSKRFRNGNFKALTANSLIKYGGAATEFLKANGTVDTNTYLTTATAPTTSLQGAYNNGDGTISGTLSTKPFVIKHGTAEILNAGASITLGTTNSPVSIIGNLTITNSVDIIPLKKLVDVPALAINTWISRMAVNDIVPETVGMRITTLKTIVVTAVGCSAGKLLAAGVFRNFTIYNASGNVVGAYTINKTVLDSTGGFVKHSITPLTLTAGIYYFAISLVSGGDYFNTDAVATSYTAFDSSVISAFTGCYTTFANTFPDIPFAFISFTSFWILVDSVDSFASIKVGSVILDGGLNTEVLKANGTVDTNTYPEHSSRRN